MPIPKKYYEFVTKDGEKFISSINECAERLNISKDAIRSKIKNNTNNKFLESATFLYQEGDVPKWKNKTYNVWFWGDFIGVFDNPQDIQAETGLSLKEIEKVMNNTGFSNGKLWMNCYAGRRR